MATTTTKKAAPKPRAKAKPAAAKTRGRAGAKPKATAKAPHSRVERAADLQVGAVLVARDTVFDAIEEVALVLFFAVHARLELFLRERG